MSCLCFSFFFNHHATTELYTLSLHDALPILEMTGTDAVGKSIFESITHVLDRVSTGGGENQRSPPSPGSLRSEEHTSELQSHSDLVCRLLLEKKKTLIPHGRVFDAYTHAPKS